MNDDKSMIWEAIRLGSYAADAMIEERNKGEQE